MITPSGRPITVVRSLRTASHTIRLHDRVDTRSVDAAPSLERRWLSTRRPHSRTPDTQGVPPVGAAIPEDIEVAPARQLRRTPPLLVVPRSRPPLASFSTAACRAEGAETVAPPRPEG